MKLTAIILTLNEARHLERCILSIKGVASEIVVVDCFSSDATLEIAYKNGARVIQNEWVSHANQFNWALTQIDSNPDWILRIDADEYLTKELALEIKSNLPNIDNEVEGIYLARRMKFQGCLICHGGVFPIDVLRLFRFGKGICENRWMDEHIKVAGRKSRFHGEIIDDNLHSMDRWIDKHNKYASREAIDLLNLRFHFMPLDSIAELRNGNRTEIKRWFKEVIYFRMPLGIRAFTYFFYRYLICMGFLDGSAGTSFHFLQGLWYRYLVDVKVSEVCRYMHEHNVGPKEAIKEIFGIQIDPSSSN